MTRAPDWPDVAALLAAVDRDDLDAARAITMDVDADVLAVMVARLAGRVLAAAGTTVAEAVELLADEAGAE